MSFYATLQGQLTYPDQESFDKIVKLLKDNEYLDDMGFFLDECGQRVFDHEPNVDKEHLALEIPYAHHRNLARVSFFSSGVKGTIVGTSTDGCFDGWVIVDGTETFYDLEEWAKNNLEEEDTIPPNQKDYDDDDDYYQDLFEWQSLVECEFHSDFG